MRTVEVDSESSPKSQPPPPDPSICPSGQQGGGTSWRADITEKLSTFYGVYELQRYDPANRSQQKANVKRELDCYVSRAGDLHMDWRAGVTLLRSSWAVKYFDDKGHLWFAWAELDPGYPGQIFFDQCEDSSKQGNDCVNSSRIPADVEKRAVVEQPVSQAQGSGWDAFFTVLEVLSGLVIAAA